MSLSKATEPSTVFCIGATKAGTSWLYTNLSKHPDAHFLPIKELHYFNTRKNRPVWVKNGLERRVKRYSKLYAEHPSFELKQDIMKIKTYQNIYDANCKGHLQYKELLHAGAGSAKIVGDFTPAYALLSAAELVEMQQCFLDPKFIFILRDPADRAWAHLRMKYQRKYSTHIIEQSRLLSLADQLLAGNLPEIDRRSHYRTTLENLEKANITSNLHIAFYENLFTTEELERLCGFLGIEAISFPMYKRVHRGPKATMPNTYREALRERYYEDYSYAYERFGLELPTKWLNW